MNISVLSAYLQIETAMNCVLTSRTSWDSVLTRDIVLMCLVDPTFHQLVPVSSDTTVPRPHRVTCWWSTATQPFHIRWSSRHLVANREPASNGWRSVRPSHGRDKIIRRWRHYFPIRQRSRRRSNDVIYPWIVAIGRSSHVVCCEFYSQLRRHTANA